MKKVLPIIYLFVGMSNPTLAAFCPNKPLYEYCLDNSVRIENCGMVTHFSHAPQRTLTVNQSATEILLALGLSEQMIGTAYLDAAIHPDLQAAYERVPVLAVKAPSQESLLAEEPDFVYASFGGMFSDATIGTRSSLHGLGIATYVSPIFCPGQTQEVLSLKNALAEILDIGDIFHVRYLAEILVDSISQQVERIAQHIEQRGVQKARVFLFDMDDRSPYTAGALGPQQLLLSSAGAKNIFDDLKVRMTSVSWEAVVERDPEIIIVVDSAWSSAEQKIRLLKTNPALRQMAAVRSDRLITLSFPDLMSSIRFGDSVEKLAQALYPEL
jgi:iron complex transport system substrate-binding protein